MESTAPAWAVPYDELQLPRNWNADEVAPADDAHVWAPAVGHPLQYASIPDIFGSSCSLQPYVVPAASGGKQQLVEYNNYNAAAAQQHHDLDPTETYMDSPEKLFQKRKDEFKDDAKLMKLKMHRYPPGIQAVGKWCTVPKVVAIGPYYHGQDHLQKVEKMKHVAAQYCIEEYETANNNSRPVPVQDMYDAVVSAATKIDARGLYDKDVMEGMSYEGDFLPMMFYDSCFLVIYIIWKSDTIDTLDKDVCDFFESNDNDIAHDIMLLENQIPLQVVHAVISMCSSVPLEIMTRFIAMWREDGFLEDWIPYNLPTVIWKQDYYEKAPHLLGLLRFYAVEKTRSKRSMVSKSDMAKIESMAISAGAIELAEMGIFLTADETKELAHMGLASKWIIFAELSLAPLSLNDARASWLVNMAALELCTTPDFFDGTAAEVDDSAVCSYLLLLGMLLHREEDVHELRTKGILQGGAGLTNKNTLDFFTSLQSLRRGRYYAHVMAEIAGYKMRRPWIKVYRFCYRNRSTIAWAGSAFAGFIGIITTLLKLRGAH